MKRTLAIVSDEQVAASNACERCKALAKDVRELRAQVRKLTEENERLVRAIQRESHVWDERVIRNK